MKKNLKFLKKLSFAIVPLGIVVAAATSCSSTTTINASGSSSLQPLMTSFANVYTDADVVVQSGGSGEGIRVAATGEKDLGNASRNPYSTVNTATGSRGYTTDDWKNRGVKTVTVAWDAIAIVYKPASTDTGTFTINSSNINTLYTAFAGTQTATLGQFGITTSDGSTSTTTLIPYARTGGSEASGTATSFFTQSGFTVSVDDTVTDALENGNYTGNVEATNESNTEAWNRVSSDNRVGSIIYLSLGFVSSNRSVIEAAGFQVAYYQADGATTGVDATTTNVGEGTYGWYSPLNTMISTVNANDATKDFVWWMVNSSEAASLISQEGFVALTSSQKSYMAYDHSGTTSDDWSSLGSDDALNNDDLKNKFFSSDVADYNLSYNIGLSYFGVPKGSN